MSPTTSSTDQKAPCGDVLLVGHGHILRAFAMRWIGRELTEGVSLLLEGTFAPVSSQIARMTTDLVVGKEVRSNIRVKEEGVRLRFQRQNGIN